MAGQGKLTELLTKEPFDHRRVLEYSRSKRCDPEDLLKLALTYQKLSKEKRFNCQVTPLHVACSGGKPEVIKTLVKEGWSVDTDLEEVDSPLRIALDNGNIAGARCLVELGADPNVVGLTKTTPMESALNNENKRSKNCVNCVKFLLEVGVSVNAVLDNETSEKPLHRAVFNDLLPVVSFLLQMGADIDAVDINKSTPLHIAVYENRLEIVKLLALHRADMYKENKAEETPLLWAVKQGLIPVINALVAGGCDVNRVLAKGTTSALHTATFMLNLDIVKVLISHGADPNMYVKAKLTPLHAIASRNVLDDNMRKNSYQLRKDLAEFLVESGGNLNNIDTPVSPLEMAIHYKYYKLAKLFIQLGANVNNEAENDRNGTVFHEIVSTNRDIIHTFLEFGANYNAYNSQRLTPYHLAISDKIDLKFIKSFVKYGCPFNQDLFTWNKVARAANWGTERFFNAENKFFKGIKENNLELIKSAVKDGAIPTGCSEDIKYPLNYLASKGYKDVLTYLLENNVPPNSVNDKGESPLFVAAKGGHYEICHTLLKFGASYNYCSRTCPKKPSNIARELKNNEVSELFKKVSRMFNLARSKNKHVVNNLQKVVVKCTNDYLMFVNATNARGDTLIATALRHNCVNNAQEMMVLRTKYAK